MAPIVLSDGREKKCNDGKIHNIKIVIQYCSYHFVEAMDNFLHISSDFFLCSKEK